MTVSNTNPLVVTLGTARFSVVSQVMLALVTQDKKVILALSSRGIILVTRNTKTITLVTESIEKHVPLSLGHATLGTVTVDTQSSTLGATSASEPIQVAARPLRNHGQCRRVTPTILVSG